MFFMRYLEPCQWCLYFQCSKYCLAILNLYQQNLYGKESEKTTTYLEDYLNYFVTLKKTEGNEDVLIFMVAFVIGSFLLKNLFGLSSNVFLLPFLEMAS